MKTIKTIMSCISFLILLNILFSCKNENNPNYESFLIQVDSIHVSDNITINEPFDIRLFGTIGYDGCKRFLKFETEKQTNDIFIKAWGEADISSGGCPTVVVLLDYEKLNFEIKEKGTYTIKVMQPNNSILEKRITVD